MAKSDTNTHDRDVEYYQHIWGDLIYGSKIELQSFGIGIAKQFPGEVGGPKRTLTVLDPRGFKTTISRSYDGERYTASIRFPGRERPKVSPEYFAAGVKKYSEHAHSDEYIGTAEALVFANLVLPDQFPGMPGMRKMRVTIFADGTVPDCAPTSVSTRRREPGAKVIERVSKDEYSVRVFTSEDEVHRRWETYHHNEREYEKRMRALPRPAPLKERMTAQKMAFEISQYRDEVKSAAATCFRVLESYMFEPEKNSGNAYSAEMREILLGHKNSIWQELSKLIDEGKIVRKIANKPLLCLVKN